MALRFDKIEFYSSANHQYPEITTDGTSSLRLKPTGSKYLDLESDSSTVYLKSNGNIYLRPNGASTNRVQFTTSGVTFSDKIIPNAHIELPYTAELRTLDTDGTVRTIARANSNKLQYGWSYAGNVEIMGGGSYTPRITISGSSGEVSIPNFTGNHSFSGDLDLSDNAINNVGVLDFTSSFPFNFTHKNYTQSNITGYSTSGSSFDDWVKIGQFGEAEGTTYLNIKCDAHSTFSFTIGRGYWGSNVATITCTNAVFNRNSSYPNLRGIRIIREDNGSGGTSSTYSVNVRMYRTSTHANFTWYCKAWGGGYDNIHGGFDFLSSATTDVKDGTGHIVITQINDISGPTAATDNIRKSIHGSEDIVSEKKIIATTEFSVTQYYRATGNNLTLSAGGNNVLNLDLNGKVYPASDAAMDLGFSATAFRFRHIYQKGNHYIYNGGFLQLHTETNDNARGFLKVYDTGPHLRIATSGNETIGFYDGGVEGTLNVEIQGDGSLNLVTGRLKINDTTVIDPDKKADFDHLNLGGATGDNGEDLKVGGIRGRFSNELIHLYQRVNIGYPSGWAGQDAPIYGLSTYGGADLAMNTGYVRVTTGSLASSDASTRGLIMDGNYTNGQYRHRWRKQDPGGGVPLYLDYAAGTASSFTTIARFGPYSNNTQNFEVYGSTRLDGDVEIGVYDTTDGGYLYLNGTTANKRARIFCSNGNLHIDSASSPHATYLNFYSGNGTAFGNGASGTVAWMGPDGDLWKGSSDNSGSKYWHANNHGSGSGLDADKLDGLEGSRYLKNPGHNSMGNYGAGDHRTAQNLYPTPASDLVNGSMNPFNTGINFCVVRHKIAESYAYNGSSWADCSSETDFNNLLGGDFSHNWGGTNLKRTKSDYIMYMSNQTGYCFIGWLVLTHSAHHNSFQIKIETTNTNPDTAAKRYENVGGSTGWTVATHIDANIGSWPGWTVDKIYQQVGGSANDYMRIRFTPTWASGQTTEISMGSLGMFASYGSGAQAASVARDYTITYNGNANYGDDKKIQLGDTQDLQIYHDGNHSYIKDNGTGSLYFEANGSNRFFIGSDVAVLGSTDFAIPQGRKLILDGIGGHTYIEEESDSNLKFYVAGSERLNMSNTTATFAGVLYANGGGDISMSSGSNGQFKVQGSGYTGAIALNASAMHIYHNSSLRDLVLGTNETARLTIAGNSGNTSITGTFTAAGDVVAYSDERLKSNIETLDGSKVYNMRGVSFTKDDKEGSGVIAQELEKVAPELVNNDSEYKSVAYGNITGYLIEAIKDLKEEIEQLKKQIK